MDLTSITHASIHPAIGVARIGNSDEYFIGPEVPYPTPPPEGGYRDASGKLKRQAAQFRIYGYNAANEVVGEITSASAEIEWTVHVANKKGAWYDFDAALDLTEAKDLKSARRNAFVQGADRDQLVIDPGPRSVSGANQPASTFDTGKFFGQTVYLGQIETDSEGRLIFVGGKGVSGSPLPGFTLVTFANNPGWHDDTSDGPVMAKVKIGDKELVADPAWVVTTPPNYSPDLVTPQTMFDVITDALNGALLSTPAKPSFTRDILPLLRQFNDAQWVNFGFAVQFGWNAPNDFLRPEILTKLATAPADKTNDPTRNCAARSSTASATRARPPSNPGNGPRSMATPSAATTPRRCRMTVSASPIRSITTCSNGCRAISTPITTRTQPAGIAGRCAADRSTGHARSAPHCTSAWADRFIPDVK